MSDRRLCHYHFKKTFTDIVSADTKTQNIRIGGENVVRSMNGNVGYEPSIELPSNQRSLPGFLEENPKHVLGNGTFKKIPLLIGVTRDETANAIDVKTIEKIFQTATKFLESVADELKAAGAIGSVVNKILPGLGWSELTFIKKRSRNTHYIYRV